MANNPGDPESASMEVSETKLVNFAEKTKFDVSSELKPPAPKLDAGHRDALADAGIEMVLPDLSTVLSKDGTWNQQALPALRYTVTDSSTVYDSLADVPHLTGVQRFRLEEGEQEYADAVRAALLALPPSSTVQIFQLDPNQLLTVSSGVKVLLRRPL